MRYNFKDLKQAITGSFVAVIIFFVLKGEPFFFDPNYGIIISIFIIYIYSKGFNSRFRKTNFIVDVIVAFVVCIIMALVFGLITKEQLLSKEVFGSLVSVGWWIAIPFALKYDKFNWVTPVKK